MEPIAGGAEGGTLEVAVVEYGGGARLNVPLYRLDQLEPYRAAGDGDAPPPRLHRLRAPTWQQHRRPTRAGGRKTAEEPPPPHPPPHPAPGYPLPPRHPLPPPTRRAPPV